MDLRHAEMKLGRAREHLDDVNRELQKYYESNPCSVTLFKRPEIERRFIRVEIADPSDRIYLIVRGSHEAWIAADPFGRGVRVLITGPQGFERSVWFAMDEQPEEITRRVRQTLDE